MVQILRDYESKLGDILDRFTRRSDGKIWIDHADDSQFRQFVIELQDFLDDIFGKNTYSTMIANFFDEGITNFTGSPSYKSVENIRGVVSSVVTRVERNSELIRTSTDKAKKDTALPKEPELPSKVTLNWLIKHVPVNLWVTAVSLLAISFALGLQASRISLVKEVFKLEVSPSPQVLQQAQSNDEVKLDLDLTKQLKNNQEVGRVDPQFKAQVQRGMVETLRNNVRFYMPQLPLPKEWLDAEVLYKNGVALYEREDYSGADESFYRAQLIYLDLQFKFKTEGR